MLLVTIPITVIAVGSLIYAWFLTSAEVRAVKVYGRSQTIALLSVFAVTMEILLIVVMLSLGIGIIQGDTIGWITGAELLFFLVALPCALMRKGLVRWCLAFASIYFMAIGGFLYAVSGIQF
jgi:hypothetical protein